MISSDKGVSIVHINARSIFRKLKQIELLYGDSDFLFCTETWLDNRYNTPMVSLQNMKILRCDRKSEVNSYNINNSGGGVCIYIGRKYKDHSCIYETGTQVTVDYEILTVLVSKPNFRHMALLCVYKPPKGKLE